MRMQVESKASKRSIVRREETIGLITIFFAAFFAIATIMLGGRILGYKIAHENFMGDETIWITAGLYYTDLISRGDFDHAHWDAPELATAGSLNQPLGKYMLGAGIRVHPNREASDLDFRGVYNYSQSVGWNAAQGKVPTEGLLRRAREVNAVIALACFVLLFASVTLYSNPFAGAVAVALVIFNNWVMVCFAWALTDTSYNLFLLLGFSAGMLFFRAEGTYRVCLGAGLCGLAGGLACSVKITGLAVLGLFFLGLIAYRVMSKRGRVREGVLWLAVFGTSALAVVYSINPFFWPVGGWDHLLELPKLYWRQKEMFELVSPSARLWPADRGRLAEIHRMLFWGYSMFSVERILFLVGAGWCGWTLWSARGEPERACAGIPLIYFLANYLFLIVFMEMNWERHYLSTVFAIKVLTAVGVVAFVWVPVVTMRKVAVQRRKGAETD